MELAKDNAFSSKGGGVANVWRGRYTTGCTHCKVCCQIPKPDVHNRMLTYAKLSNSNITHVHLRRTTAFYSEILMLILHIILIVTVRGWFWVIITNDLSLKSRVVLQSVYIRFWNCKVCTSCCVHPLSYIGNAPLPLVILGKKKAF